MSILLGVSRREPYSRSALKDRAYRATPLGLDVARYYRWKKNEWGAQPETLRDYEAILARLALFFPDLELTDFAPPAGTERLRECWDHYWGDRSPRTRAKVRSVWVDFFDWAGRERQLQGNPARALARPKGRGVERGTFELTDVAKLITEQARARDRIALHLLFQLALRKSELAGIQRHHFRHDGRRLIIHGKGGKVASMPVPDDVRVMIQTYTTTFRWQPQEFLLYPEKTTARNGERVVLRAYRDQPMTSTTLHRWFKRMLKNAGLPPQRLHDTRHTSLTEFIRQTGNLKLAQQLARHESIQTTGDIYGHLNDQDLQLGMEQMKPLV